jgi:hypothetical protein
MFCAWAALANRNEAAMADTVARMRSGRFLMS